MCVCVYMFMYIIKMRSHAIIGFAKEKLLVPANIIILLTYSSKLNLNLNCLLLSGKSIYRALKFILFNRFKFSIRKDQRMGIKTMYIANEIHRFLCTESIHGSKFLSIMIWWLKDFRVHKF